MKKFYSLVAAVAIAATVSAQGTETFEAQTALSASYADGSFAGETAGVTVNYVHSRDQGDFAINGTGIMLRRADEPSSVEFVIPNGVGEFTFSYRKAFTGGENNRVLAVFVDGVQQEPTIGPFGASGADATVHTATVPVNKEGNVSVKISYPTGTANGNKQVTIDNVSWTAAVTMGIGGANATKVNLVKNTVADNNLVFATKGEVKIVSLAGQVVKTAVVSDNTVLNIADLAKGMYIVTGIVDGKTVSQKIIKK